MNPVPSLESVARRLPASVRKLAIRALNPLRVRRAKAACTPRWITVFVTNHCNARCEHCFYWSELNSRAPELSADDFGRLFRSLRRPVRTVRLSGGEPFLRPDLEDIVLAADATRRVRRIAIPTHGMMRDLPERLEALLPALRCVHVNVSVSFDGLRERHDANRKIPHGFDRAVENLRRLRDLESRSDLFSRSASISLTPAVSARRGGRREVLELVDFLKRETGLDAIGWDHVRSVETDAIGLPPDVRSGFTPPPPVEEAPDVRNARRGDVQLSVDEKEEVNGALEALCATTRGGRLTKMRLDAQLQILRSRRRVVDCLAGFVDCVVYPSGEIAVCEFTRPFANLHDFGMDLPRAMSSEQARGARARTRACACTHPCHLSDSLAYDADFLVRFFGA